MLIIGGPSSQTLASRVAFEMGTYPVVSDFLRFPDNEQYLRIQYDVSGEDVVLIQSTVTDSDLFALIQMIDACSEAKTITCVIPYMGYARQDKLFNPGEPLSARAAAKSINCDRVFTINIHEKSILDYFSCPATDLDASPLIGKYISNLDLDSPLLIAPDRGVEEMVKNTASGLNLEYDVFDKTRLSGDSVVIEQKTLDLSKRDVIMIDDMIATGGTMAESIKMLKNGGAKRVFVGCVHPVLARNAVLRLFNSGVSDIFATDTIEKIQSSISVSSLIVDNI
ncbi:MAG: ribose-phosphate diphosphokinase [Methanosarcinaceae archaeon]|nr:ribose-phosphate diphosphokinase [Methanosarcinaceae archaeon]